MKLTIIPIDGAVYKDGVSYSNLDLSAAPAEVHALQFNDVSSKGWIEFTENDEGAKAANEVITSLPDWAIIASTKWDEAKTAQEQAILAALAAKEAAKEAAKDQPATSGVTTI
jgi:hypothetical protein